MSMFFKALEQAERDRNGRQRERTSREPSSTGVPDANGAAASHAVEVVPAPASAAMLQPWAKASPTSRNATKV